MPKKKVVTKNSAEGALVTAAKSIGKAAGRIASVVSAAVRPGSLTEKKLSKPPAKAKKSMPAKKTAAKGPAASKTRKARRKTKPS